MRIVDTPGNSPLAAVPPDYAAGGASRWLVLDRGPDAGKRMFFLDHRPAGGDDGPVVLLVHGNPECSYTFRSVIAELATRDLPAGTRVVAPDHIGFGRSDQATFEMVDMHHAANLEQLVAALDLRRMVLVVHDWGGPIGIGALLPAADRVDGLVVLNSTVFPMPAEGPTYENYPVPVLLPWARTPDLVPDRLWGTFAAHAVSVSPGGLPSIVGGYGASLVRTALGRGQGDPAAAVFRGQFASRANVRSSKRMVRQTPVWGHGYVYEDPMLGRQDNRAFYRDLQERLPQAWGPPGRRIPAAGVFGAWDPLAKPAVLDQWRSALPQLDGRIAVLEGVSHFVEEQRPRDVADAIVAVLGDVA